jgi:hypothetical protein
VNDRNRLCGAAAMSQRRSGFWCCERTQRENPIHSVGSKPPNASAATRSDEPSSIRSFARLGIPFLFRKLLDCADFAKMDAVIANF